MWNCWRSGNGVTRPFLDRDYPGGYLAVMRSIALKDLETNVSEYVHLAEHGETVLVLDQDRVIAELVPPRHAAPPDDREPPLAEAIRQGWVRPAVTQSGIPPRLPVAPLRELLEDLEASRGER